MTRSSPRRSRLRQSARGVELSRLAAPARRRSWCRRRGRCARRCRRAARTAWPGSTASSVVRSLRRPAGGAGAALEQGVAGEHAAEVGRVEAAAARRVARACAGVRSVVPPTLTAAHPSGRSRSQRWSVWVSSHSGLSSGCSRIGATTASRSAGATRQWSSCAWVSRIALTLRPPTTSRMASTSCGASMTDALVVVADHPDVVVDVEGLAVEGERAAGRRRGRPAGPPSEDRRTERSTSPPCIRSNAASTSSERDLLGDERVQVEPALLVEVDEHREVADGQAVAVPAGLQRRRRGRRRR